MSTTTPEGDIGPDRWADPSVTYDVVAPDYAETFQHELEHKPFDRALLARFAAAVRDGGEGGYGPVCDLGCGPAHIGAHLAGLGVEVIGIDRSRGMLVQARRLNPAMGVCQSDMTALGLGAGSLRGIACFYALIHIPRVLVPVVLGELHGALAVGGHLLLAVHGGEGALHATRMLEHPVSLHATLFSRAELVGLLEATGFTITEGHERDPYEQESLTRRVYVWATRPATVGAGSAKLTACSGATMHP